MNRIRAALSWTLKWSLLLGGLFIQDVLCSPSIADELTAKELYSFCISTDQGIRNICSKYVLGVFQGMNLAAKRLNDSSLFCAPEYISDKGLADIFIQTAKLDFMAYPQDKAMPAVSLVAATMIHAFPCQKR